MIKSAKAQFDANAKTLFSDGNADIELNIPVEGPRHGRMVKIHSSGITFQSETGKATTDRQTAFEFDQGGGTAVGADYDPQTRELHLHSQVSLDWRGKTADSVPMHIEAGEAYYKERESKVVLLQWSKLTRDTLHMEGGMSVVTLDQGDVREAVLKDGRGERDDPDRKVEFSADYLNLHFADGMVVDKINGDRNARLVSTAQTMRTTVTGKFHGFEFRRVEQRQHADRCGLDRFEHGGGGSAAEAGNRARRNAHSAQRHHPPEDAQGRQRYRERGNRRSRHARFHSESCRDSPNAG